MVTGLLGEMGKSLRAKGAVFGIVDAHGVGPPYAGELLTLVSIERG